MTVYVDLIFMVNFMIDGVMLLATARARKLSIVYIRIIASAVLGASYVLMMFVPSLHVLFTFGLKMMFSMAMIFIAFGFGSLQHYVRNLAVFYMINFSAAGLMLAIHYYDQSAHDVLNGIVFTQSGGITFTFGMGIVIVCLLLPLALWLYQLMSRSAQARDRLQSFVAQVEVEVGHFRIKCEGLIDTGNQLTDPLTRTPVMIMEAELWKEVLPDSWLRSIHLGNEDKIVMTVSEEGDSSSSGVDLRHRLRFVPYKGIHKGTHFMLAVKPDKVTVRQMQQSWSVNKVLIGLKGEPCCSDGTYHAIIHPSLVSGTGS